MPVGEKAGDGRRWAISAAVIAISIAATGLYFVKTNRLLSFDAISLFSPYYTLLSDMARSGEFMLWNPWSNCGSPDVAYVEMGTYSPLTILHAALTGGGHTGFLIYWLTIIFIAGLGFLFLGRHLGAPAWGSLAVSLSFVSCGFFIGHSTHTSWLYSFAFLPVLVWRLDVALQRRQLWPAIEAGALWGLSALAGHPAVVIVNGLFLAAWALGRSLFPAASSSLEDPQGDEEGRPDLRSRTFRSFVALALLLVIGVVVLSPAYAAFLVEAPGYSDRAGSLTRDVVISDHRLYPGALAGLVSPFIPLLQFDNPDLWVGTWTGLNAIYIGSLVPALAILALLLGRRSSWRWWLAGLALLNLGFALGESLPLRGWLYDLLPPTRYFRHTALFRGYLLFGISVLALLGTRDLASRMNEGGKTLVLLALAAVGLSAPAAATYWVMLNSVRVVPAGLGLANLHFVVAWIGLPLILGLARSAPRWRTHLPSMLVLLVLADGALSIEQSMPLMSVYRYQIPDPSERRDRTVEIMKAGLARSGSARMIDTYNTHLFHKTPLLQTYSSLNSRFHTTKAVGSANWFNLEQSWSDVPVLRQSVSDAPQRFWFSSRVAEVVPSDATFSAFLAQSNRLNGIPLVIHEPGKLIDGVAPGERDPRDQEGIDRIEKLPAAELLPVDLVQYGPTAMEFSVNAPRDGWLLVTDRWARGWNLRVDGKVQKLWGGDYLFRALEVSEGEHRVEFHYRPFGHPWLMIVSWATLGTVLATSLVRMRMLGQE